MKTGLLKKDALYRLRELSEFDKALIDDMELDLIFREIDNNYLKNVFTKVLMDSLKTKEEILFRQEVFADLLANKVQTIKLYELTSDIIYDIKDHYRFGIIDNSPSSVVRSSVDLLKYTLEQMPYIRDYLENFKNVKSYGLSEFIKNFLENFSPEVLAYAAKILGGMNFDNGFMYTAELDSVMTEGHYVFNRSTYFDRDSKRRWRRAEKITFPTMTESLVNDTNKKLDLCFKSVAPVMGRVTNDIADFLNTLKAELGFYVAALQLLDKFKAYGIDYCIPQVGNPGDYIYENLVDVALSMRNKKMAVGNNHNIHNKKLMVITGANQGGKTTFLRSFGQATLMMQAGIFVGAKSCTLGILNGIYSHFDREEDTSMESGKLDDELKRLSKIIDTVTPGSIVLLNESFQSTNEREGSSIGFEIIRALSDSGVLVISVTHMFEMAEAIRKHFKEDVIFMRAERTEDGSRSFRISENETLRTSFAMDLYNKIF